MKPAAAPQSKQARKSSFPLVKRLARAYIRPYAGSLVVAMFFMMLDGAMTAGVAKLMQPVLDDVLSGNKEDMIVPVAMAVFACFVFRGVATYAHTVLMNRVGHFIVSDIQSDLFTHFMRLDLSFFHANPSGQLISRVVNDVNVMRGAVSDTLTSLGKSAVTLVFLIGVMFWQDWVLTLAAFVVFPFLSFFVVYLGRKLRKVSGSIQHELGGLSDLLSQTFQSVRNVKAYNLEDAMDAKVRSGIAQVRDLNIKAVRLSTLSTPVNEVLVGMILGGIIVYGGYQVLSGQTTAGGLGSFLAAFIMAYEPMKKLAKLNNSLQMGLGAADRVFSMMDIMPEISSKEDAVELEARNPDVVFRDVAFQYEGQDKAALNGIGFTAASGKVTALVGPSGGGKSTLLNMIPRFYDAEGGAVLVGGVDVRDMTLSSLRSHIALVSQDITVFNDSVFENIRYGDLNAGRDAVIDAAKAAAAHDFIEAFPEGYETIVGENGVKLSGGQRQRIAIARAILRNAPILLLDEATSALDNESEKIIQQALRKLEKGRTTIVIAHRLTTVRAADQILVLEGGRIVESGTHDSLMENRAGVYARMYETGLKS
ncbi:MAG: ATP-binding cassette domain-containing protein [Alphaproteobacteria bacterium]|nr:ATP-binding cassette domain-containing protein [Alphaproteobacteria bacterium]